MIVFAWAEETADGERNSIVLTTELLQNKTLLLCCRVFAGKGGRVCGLKVENSILRCKGAIRAVQTRVIGRVQIDCCLNPIVPDDHHPS